jgi:hypothetical protein
MKEDVVGQRIAVIEFGKDLTQSTAISYGRSDLKHRFEPVAGRRRFDLSDVC